jgi:hypothetical protein
MSSLPVFALCGLRGPEPLEATALFHPLLPDTLSSKYQQTGTLTKSSNSKVALNLALAVSALARIQSQSGLLQARNIKRTKPTHPKNFDSGHKSPFV